uniref:Uncharacterized protein n=1 Tax=Oryza glaberrima TaxID=4538 RepID=I1PJG9_ORYGL
MMDPSSSAAAVLAAISSAGATVAGLRWRGDRVQARVESHLVEVHGVCALVWLIEARDMDEGPMMNVVFDTGDGDLVVLAFNARARKCAGMQQSDPFLPIVKWDGKPVGDG